MTENKNPPGWVDRFLTAILKDRFVDEAIGDMHEWYAWKQGSMSGFRLNLFYMLGVFQAIRPYKIKKIGGLFLLTLDAIMISNNVKISLRSLLAHRLFTFINLLGLTISLVSFLFIYTYVKYELSYDNFHPKADHIYKVLKRHPQTGHLSRSTSTPLAEAFLLEFEGDMQFARYGEDPAFVRVGDDKYYEGNFYWGDSTLFNVFNMPFLYGNPKKALTEKNTLVLTQEVSEKYFGEGTNPVGKLLPVKLYDGNVEMLMRVDGVMRSLPPNTDLPFEIIGSIANAFELYSQFNDSWSFFWLHTYAYIPDVKDLSGITGQIPNLVEKNLGPQYVDRVSYHFQPLKKMHLYSAEVERSGTDGNVNYIITFALAGIFIIIIAAINYLNLMGARVNKRRKETNIRKVLGANKAQLFGQFLTESILTVFASLLISLVLSYLLWPSFKGFLGKELPMSVVFGWDTLVVMLVIALLSGTLSGLYPAWLLATVPTNQVVDKHKSGIQRNRFLKILVSFQFSISMFLILSTLVIFRQVNFMSKKHLGFNKEQLLSIKVEDKSQQEKILLIKDQMGALPGVGAVTVSGETLPSQMNNGGGLQWDGKPREEAAYVHIVAIDQDFFETLEIPLIHGKNFSRTNKFEPGGPIIINRAAMELMGTASPVNKKVKVNGDDYIVAGVVENYHYQSLQTRVLPTVFCMVGPGDRLSPDNILIRTQTDDIQASLEAMEDVWNDFSGNADFSFHFVDESFQAIYESERRFLKLFTGFALLSIIISCMGLYGIVLFTTEEKSKEISLRKALGSSVLQIVSLVTKRFLVLILIGFVVGIPLAVYFSTDWLQQFSYRITVDAITVVASVVIVLFISLLTIGLHTMKAAMVNPVDHLRNE